jgi:hypothetical protein
VGRRWGPRLIPTAPARPGTRCCTARSRGGGAALLAVHTGTARLGRKPRGGSPAPNTRAGWMSWPGLGRCALRSIAASPQCTSTCGIAVWSLLRAPFPISWRAMPSWCASPSQTRGAFSALHKPEDAFSWPWLACNPTSATQCSGCGGIVDRVRSASPAACGQPLKTPWRSACKRLRRRCGCPLWASSLMGHSPSAAPSHTPSQVCHTSGVTSMTAAKRRRPSMQPTGTPSRHGQSAAAAAARSHGSANDGRTQQPRAAAAPARPCAVLSRTIAAPHWSPQACSCSAVSPAVRQASRVSQKGGLPAGTRPPQGAAGPRLGGDRPCVA